MLLRGRTFLVPLMSSLLNWGSISPTKEQTALVNGIICIGLGLASMSEAAGTGQLGIGCWDVDPPSQLQLAERGSGGPCVPGLACIPCHAYGDSSLLLDAIAAVASPATPRPPGPPAHDASSSQSQSADRSIIRSPAAAGPVAV